MQHRRPSITAQEAQLQTVPLVHGKCLSWTKVRLLVNICNICSAKFCYHTHPEKLIHLEHDLEMLVLTGSNMLNNVISCLAFGELPPHWPVLSEGMTSTQNGLFSLSFCFFFISTFRFEVLVGSLHLLWYFSQVATTRQKASWLLADS